MILIVNLTPLDFSAVVDSVRIDVLDTMRAEYLSNNTPEERKSYIASVYYAVNQNDDLMNSFLVEFKKGLSYLYTQELDTMARGTIYIPPHALSLLEELKKLIPASDFASFLEDLRYRSLDESEVIARIENRLNQVNFKDRNRNRIHVLYEEDGVEKEANVPFLQSKKLHGTETHSYNAIPDPVVAPVVTAEEQIVPVVDLVVTE